MIARMKALVLASGRLCAVLAIFAVVIFLTRIMSAPSGAQSPSSREERVLESFIAKQVPVKVKIKKEKEESFKDLKNERWVREFELEVTNSGERPIYFLDIDLVTDVKVGGAPLVFTLIYGRPELGDVISRAWPDDIPIKPGETYVFKIHSGQVPAWESGVRHGDYPQAKKLKVALQMLSFGDGTGFVGNGEYPPARKQSPHKLGSEQRNKNGPETLEGVEIPQPDQLSARFELYYAGKCFAGKFFIVGIINKRFCKI